MKFSRQRFFPKIAGMMTLAVLASVSALGNAQQTDFPQNGESPSNLEMNTSNSTSISSSSSATPDSVTNESLPSAPVAAETYDHRGRNSAYRSRLDHLAIEAGGGLTSPIGNDRRFDTFGYNITAGAGWYFTRKFGALIEYQFNRNKIPGATLSLVGVPGGNVNTYSITIDPIFQYAKIGNFGGYVTGGGGFYRKVTNYTAPQQTIYCDPYYGCGPGYQNQTVGHFSSNQGGFNFGTGATWSAFGDESRAKLYAEVRYEWIDSPRGDATHAGTGTEGFIPLTLGVRF
jgi:hypothetical protein